MSEEQIDIEEVTNEETVDETVDETSSATPDDGLTPEQRYDNAQVEKATSDGWKPFDDWVANGGDPEKWVPAATFNVRGEFIGKIKSQEREFNDRLTNVNKIHEAQLRIQREELEAERKEAIKRGGQEAVTAVENIDKQLAELNNAAPAAPAGIPPELEQWNSENTWISQPGARSTFAQTNFAQAIKAGYSVANAIKHVEGLDQKEFPQAAPAKKKESAPLSAGGTKPGVKTSSGKALTWGDLTPDEVKIFKALPGAWKSEADYLKSVADTRKG